MLSGYAFLLKAQETVNITIRHISGISKDLKIDVSLPGSQNAHPVIYRVKGSDKEVIWSCKSRFIMGCAMFRLFENK
ncbi:MAG: hypothetical protein AB2L24_19140 [Mangrovibacterium sp.]